MKEAGPSNLKGEQLKKSEQGIDSPLPSWERGWGRGGAAIAISAALKLAPLPPLPALRATLSREGRGFTAAVHLAVLLTI